MSVRWWRARPVLSRVAVAVVVIPGMAVLSLTGCGASDGVSPGEAGLSTSGRAPGTHEAATGTLPNLVGKGLQFAQDTAQAAGFKHLTSHDALGRGRAQILDRDWQVCDQSPAVGSHPVTTRVDFGVVRLDETCPAAGTVDATIPTVGATMPNLTGRSVKVARNVFGDNASITLHDATGKDRVVIIESNWKICSTSPAAGRPYSLGNPVTLNVVKFEEICP